MKTVQELLRHASTRITLDVYTQAVTPAKRQAQSKDEGFGCDLFEAAVTPAKRQAQSKVIAMIRPKNERNCVPESVPKDFGANPVSA